MVAAKQYPALILSGLTLIVCLSGLAGPVEAQGPRYISQQGHLLDANPSIVDNYGRNYVNRRELQVNHPDLYISGNVTDGKSFQGFIPYQSTYEFSGQLGADSLNNFRRDSTGFTDLTASNYMPRPYVYVDPSRGVTRVSGGNIFHTSELTMTEVSPVGASLRQSVADQMRYSESNMARVSRPLDMSQTRPMYITSEAEQQSDNRRQAGRRVRTPLYEGEVRGEETDDDSAVPDEWQIERPEKQFDKRADDEEAMDDQQADPQAEEEADDIEVEPVDVSDMVPKIRDDDDQEQPQDQQQRRDGTAAEPTIARPKGKRSEISGSEQVSMRAQSEYHMREGESLMRQGEYFAAAAAFDSAAVFSDRDPIIYAAKSFALFGAEQYMSSAFYLRTALELYPDFAKVHINLNTFYANRETVLENLADLDQWQQESGHTVLLLLKGYFEYQLGQYQQAKLSIEAFLEEESDFQAANVLMEEIEAGMAR